VIGPDLEPEPGDWGDYAITVARRLARDFGPGLLGADVVFSSDLPPAAGLSSSSALVVGIGLVLRDVNRLTERPAYLANIPSPVHLGGYFGAVENGLPFGELGGGGGVGTLGGSQDQTAILISRPDALAQIRFLPVALERVVPLPAGLTFVVAASGIEAQKTGAALAHYNGLALLTARLDQLVRDATGGQSLGSVIRSAPAESAGWLLGFPAAAGADHGRLRDRLTQLIAECRYIIPGVALALESADLDRLCELTKASQAGAEVALWNQVPETVALVEEALHSGAVAASAFGAGFGGSVWALVESADAERFAEWWRRAYAERFPHRADAARVFRTRPAPPAVRLTGPEPGFAA
jgi:galactokinase